VVLPVGDVGHLGPHVRPHEGEVVHLHLGGGCGREGGKGG
jgi:hypothetical protein